MINTDCPLCGTDVAGREELRVHLMVDHRKSDVIDACVDRLAAPARTVG